MRRRGELAACYFFMAWSDIVSLRRHKKIALSEGLPLEQAERPYEIPTREGTDWGKKNFMRRDFLSLPIITLYDNMLRFRVDE